MDAIKVKLIGLSRGGGGNLQPNKTATPTKQEQTVRPDPGYDGLRQVTVEAIPDAFQDVTGVNTVAEDIRVGKIGIDANGNLLNGEMLPRKPEQEKSVVPTKQAQTVSPDPDYALSAVNVAKIPDAYQDVSFVNNEAADIRVGKTGVSATGERLDGQMLPRKPEQSKSVTPTKSSQLVEPDSGYALSAVEVDAIPDEYANVSGVTADADKVKSGYVFVNSDGVETQGTNTDDADTSDGTMSASQLEANAVGYSRGQRIVGTKPIRRADVEIDSLSPVPIPAGSYDGTASAKLSSAAAAEVVASNIRQGAEILGVQGSYQGVDTLKALNENTLTEYSDSSATNIRAYLFYNNTTLQSASFPNATEAGAYAFQECSGLTEIDLPNLTTMGGNVFHGCSGLTEIDLPNLTTMGGNVFQNCSGLTEIDLPNLTTMGGSIGNATNVTSLNLPKLLATPNWGLAGLTNITRIDLPSLTDCGDNTFRNLRKLEVVTMMSVTVIRGTAFNSATLCATIVLGADTVCTLMSSSGLPPVALLTVYIKESLYNHLGDGTSLDYKSATNWSVYDAQGKIAWAKIEGSPYEVTT